jgi:hypothetical protein
VASILAVISKRQGTGWRESSDSIGHAKRFILNRLRAILLFASEPTEPPERKAPDAMAKANTLAKSISPPLLHHRSVKYYNLTTSPPLTDSNK